MIKTQGETPFLITESNKVVQLEKKYYLGLIQKALEEDVGTGDITTNSIIDDRYFGEALLFSKSHGILSGMDVFTAVFEELDPTIKLTFYKKDGEVLHWGEKVAMIAGKLRTILTGERIALNFIQRMSGIATKTNNVVRMLEGLSVAVLDTRKTLPGYRYLDKYSVMVGGGKNHRMGLYDMALIKDNHIKAAGSITKAVELVRKIKKDIPIEVEASTLTEVQEAADCNVDVIMFDNMNNSTVQKGIEIVNGRCKIEISGNIKEDRINELADLKVDYISMGALTHSVKAFDFSVKVQNSWKQ